MKKFEEKPLLGALGFSTSGQFAFKGEKAKIKKALGKIEIDGDLKEFAGCQPIYINDKKKITDGNEEDWKGEEDCSAKVRLLWDSKNLYVGVEIKDDVPMLNKAAEVNNLWQGDNIELFIGTHYNLVSREQKGDYDYQIFMAPSANVYKNGEPVLYSAFGTGMGVREKELINSKIASKKTDNGCIVEARISVDNFYDFDELRKAQELRFEIGLDGADRDTRKIQIMWNGSDSSTWDNPDLWGVAVLTD